MIHSTTLKILVVTPFFYPHVGGSQQYMEDLYATLLFTHKDMTIDVLCYNTDQALKQEQYRGMNIYRMSCLTILPGQFALPNPFELMTFLLSHRNAYDVIHASTRFFDSSWWAVVWAKIIRVPIVLTDHCAYHPTHSRRVISLIARIIDDTIVNASLRFYAKIFATSASSTKFLKKTYGVSAVIAYGGVDTRLFKRRQKKTARQKPCVVYAGRMIASKGVELLFSIARQIKSVEFLFIGPGPLESILRASVRKERLSHIRIRGAVKRTELARILSGCDIFIHPSFHHEGFPNVLLEAGASGLAVIATNVGGTKEIIIHRRTGLLVSPGNRDKLKKAILLLARDIELRKRLSFSLYRFVRIHFNWSKLAERFYKEFLR